MKKLLSTLLILLFAMSLIFALSACGSDENPVGDVSPQGEKGDTGAQGPQGEKGDTPTIEISDDGYWIINGSKTEHKAIGEKGEPDTSIDENLQGLAFYLQDDGTYAVEIGNAKLLSRIEIPSTYNGKAVTAIGNFYAGDSKLQEIKIPSTVKYIFDNAFAGCVNLNKIEYENNTGLEEIGAYAFSGCKSLTSITISPAVTSIGAYAFENCTGLTEIRFNANAMYSTNAANKFSNAGKDGEGINVIIGNNVKVIPSFLFCQGAGSNSKAKIISVEFESGSVCEYIWSYAFSDCDALTNITVPDSVTEIGGEVFARCTSLTSITVGNGVTEIGWSAFNGCSSLTIYCEAAAQLTGWDSSWNASSCPVVWSCNNNDIASDGYTYAVINGIRYALKDEIATVATQPTNITEVNIPSAISYNNNAYIVSSIADKAFSNCSELVNATIGNSIKSIGNSAFEDCEILTSIIIPGGVAEIGEYAFTGCSSLTIYCEAAAQLTGWHSRWNASSRPCPVVWSCNNNDIASDGYTYAVINGIKYALKDNKAIVYNAANNITTANIPSTVTYKDIIYTVTSISHSAFSDCINLSAVTIPDTVTFIDSFAFRNCDSLTTITIPDSVVSISDCVFDLCDNLISIEFDDITTWYRTSSYQDFISNSNGTEVDVFISDDNAKRFEAYSDYYWYKK